MRSWVQVAIALGALALALSPAPGQGLPEEQTYTVRIDDTLASAIRSLREEHGISISADQVLTGTRVVLELEDATEKQIVRAICAQVGAVYTTMRGRHGRPMAWLLREGGWDLDPRPRARVEGYDVMVEGVSLSHSRATDYRWGRPAPEQGETDALVLTLHVDPDGAGADRRLVGVLPGESLLDTGAALTGHDAERDWLPVDVVTAQMGQIRLSFVSPAGDAQAIAELRGRLGLYHAVDWGRAELSPADVGQARPFGSGTCTLTDWQVADGKIEVTVITPAAALGLVRADHIKVSLLGPDGAEVSRMLTGRVEIVAEGVKGVYRFGQPEEQELRLAVEGWVLSGPIEELPFTIRDVPLP